MAASVDDESVSTHEDPSVTKQYDRTTPYADQLRDFYRLVDSHRISLLVTDRGQTQGGGGLVSRAMAVSRREACDFQYLCNIHSAKVREMRANPHVNITFFDDGGDLSWASISGVATLSGREDPRVREIYSPVVAAWFGDLGDGVHSGGADDPRMCLVNVKATRISYYLATSTSKVARMAEMAKSVALGKVAQTGVLRELSGDVLEGARAAEKSSS